MNLCGACGLDFGSVSAFDAHRVGKHEYLWSPERPDGRRCLSGSELALAVDKSGTPKFAQNSRGKWSLTQSLAAQHRLTHLRNRGVSG